MTVQSRVGRVVRIRVNPSDCITCLDIVDKIGMNHPQASFDQIVKWALSSLLESARQQGLVPDPSKSDYAQRVEQRFAQHKRTADALRLAQIGNLPNHQVPAVVPADPKRARVQRRYEELAQKYEADADNFTEGDLLEFNTCMAMLDGTDPIDLTKLRG